MGRSGGAVRVPAGLAEPHGRDGQPPEARRGADHQPPGRRKSFDYDDYWDGADLIYTGHGQRGDQQRTGTNRYVGDNLRTLLVFEQAGPAQLRYVGSPVCVDEWPELRWTATATIAALFASVCGSRLTRRPEEDRLGTALWLHLLTRNGGRAPSTDRARRARDRATAVGDDAIPPRRPPSRRRR